MNKMNSLERTKRLLAVLPWIESQNGPFLDEVARRFDYPEEELVEDLENVVFFVGVYPFTPDCLIEVSISEDRVWVRYADWFRKPMKLAAHELSNLRAAGIALLEFTEILSDEFEEELGPLERGLAKLSAFQNDSKNAVEIKLATPSKHLADVQSSIKNNSVIEIDYLVASRNEVDTRKIEPQQIFTNEGKWYLQAYCRKSADTRTFRIDRIRDLRNVKDVRETEINKDQKQETFFNLENLPIARIDIPSEEIHLSESFSNIEVEEIPNEKIRLHCPIASQTWLKHLLLVLGSNSKLIEIPFEEGESMKSKTAKDLLKIYNS